MLQKYTFFNTATLFDNFSDNILDAARHFSFFRQI